MKHPVTTALTTAVAAVALGLPAASDAVAAPAGPRGDDVTRKAASPAQAQRSDQILCPVDDLDVPEYSTGVVTA
jgi:hypothetical protein